ncbi:MAG: transporter substrate-binding domain-containing protein, partial [Chloroflexi bacterium]|nr:transporter substrate-binding domain-containing protein [Chloroflexota bacterium]
NEPLVFVREDGTAAGIYVDILNYIATKAHWRIEYVPGTWSQCLERLSNDEIDLLVAIEYSEERAQVYDFSDEVVLTNWGQIYAPSGANIQSVLDLNGKSIAVLRGDIYAQGLKEIVSRFGMTSRFVEMDEYAAVFEAISNREVDAGQVPHLYGTQHEMSYDVDKTTIICCPMELRFAAPKGQQDRELLLIIDKELALLKADQGSAYYRAVNRWLGFAGVERVELPDWVGWILALAGAIGLMLLGTSVVLKSQVQARTAELSRKNAELQIEIVERAHAQAEIVRLQHLLQNITDSMPSALITLDPAGHILTWNPAAEALTGQTEAQVQGQMLWQASPELARYRELFERVLCEGQILHQHKEQLGTDLNAVYRDVSIFPLQANDINGAVLRIDDVTRRVQLEEMMLQSAKMASVGGLAAGVAHEINNPLGAMMQSAQMLQLAFDTQRPRVRERLQSAGVDPDALEHYLSLRGVMDYLEGIRSSGERAAKIVSDLLSFSRKSSSKAAPHGLNQLVEQTLDLAATDYDLKKKYDFRDMIVVRDLTPGLPQVFCDGQQIQQVILNLVRNAAQAMSERREHEHDYKPRLIMLTALAPDEQYVRLEVVDNGPGIPEAIRSRLFEPFFTTKGVGRGTGLGLWLCWSIVAERHKGRIRVEAAADGGSRFIVELPIAPLAED